MEGEGVMNKYQKEEQEAERRRTPVITAPAGYTENQPSANTVIANLNAPLCYHLEEASIREKQMLPDMEMILPFFETLLDFLKVCTLSRKPELEELPKWKSKNRVPEIRQQLESAWGNFAEEQKQIEKILATQSETLTVHKGFIQCKPYNSDFGAKKYEELKRAAIQLLEAVLDVREFSNRKPAKVTKREDAQTSNQFIVDTSQEMQEALSAITDVDDGLKNWTEETNGAGDPLLVHQSPKRLTHSSVIEGTPDEDLFQIAKRLNGIDGFWILLYVLEQLAPKTYIPDNAQSTCWLDLNDIAKKTGLDSRNTQEARERRRFVWHSLEALSKLRIVGERSILYKSGNETIPTRIDAPPFTIAERQMPEQLELFQDIPVAVRLTLSETWERVLNHSKLRQWLPFGELIGQIPTKQPSNRWARTIAYPLLCFWRREPQLALSPDGGRKTRRELLSEYALSPTMQELIEGQNPKRVIEYYSNAISALVERGLVSPFGDGIPKNAQDITGFPRNGCVDEWLNRPANLMPGDKIRGAIEAIANKREISIPKIEAPKQGRPRR